MSPSPIKVGFVGLSSAGWASMALAPTLFSLPDKYTLTAVSTTSEASATESAKKQTDAVGHPVKAYYGDTAQIAKDPDVDFVVVAVKAPSHKAAVLPAIEAGKDIFIEWPAGAGSNQTVEIAEAARRKGVRTMVGLQGRQSAIAKKVKQIASTECMRFMGHHEGERTS
jgi:predicted dehydrogenase